MGQAAIYCRVLLTTYRRRKSALGPIAAKVFAAQGPSGKGHERTRAKPPSTHVLWSIGMNRDQQ
jgi:hypothetical protein